jgi:hypothetical protein
MLETPVRPRLPVPLIEPGMESEHHMKPRRLLPPLALAATFVAAGPVPGEPMTAEIRIPASLRVEHEELHAELAALTKAPGKVGETARAVGALLHPHFVKEEEYALPPLGLLIAIARGTVTPAMRPVVAMSERLKRELPEMLGEHKAVVAALEKLAQAGKAGKRADAVRFAEKLRVHAETEEEVLYPAAILVGDYVKGRLGE